MEYRVQELNGKFYIEAKIKEYETYWWFGWKEKNIKYVWRRLNNKGRINNYGRIGIHFSLPLMKGFKSLKKARKKIKDLEEKPKYHY